LLRAQGKACMRWREQMDQVQFSLLVTAFSNEVGGVNSFPFLFYRSNMGC